MGTVSYRDGRGFVNQKWLLENADFPIKYIVTKDDSFIPPLLQNVEVKAWLERLTDRAMCGDLSAMHGSHDYRYENIVGKCYILGLNAKIPQFDSAMRVFIDFLSENISDGNTAHVQDEKLTFGKVYRYRDYETVLACYLPFLGYAHEESVQYVANKRVNAIYEFTKQGRYDIYRSDYAYPGANKAWKPYIVDPELYKDGNIALPSIHDLILFAGMYADFDSEAKGMVETIVRWLFGEGYAGINERLYYYAADDPCYQSKAINSKVRLPDLRTISQADAATRQALLYLCFVLSHFATAREWVLKAVLYFEQYKTEMGRYIFPKEMIAEKKDCYVVNGGHMNVGEDKRNRNYAEIISTYWMDRIFANL